MSLNGKIFACALYNRLMERWRAGDETALAVLLRAVPHDLPPAIRRQERDREIGLLFRDLRAAHPELSAHRIAQILAVAGDQLQRGHGALRENRPR
jgi:hypothetical protein